MSRHSKPFSLFPRLLFPALALLALMLLGPAAQAQSGQGTIADVADFTGANGEGPASALVYNSATGLFYSTATEGGANSEGDVFSFNPINNTLIDVGDFNSSFNQNGGNGGTPFAPLVYDMGNGLYYGTTLYGGANDDGDVFSFNPNTDVITDVGASYSGQFPIGALTYDLTNGLFYGTAQLGAVTGDGDVYSFNPTTGVITDAGDFHGSNGTLPSTTLVYDSVNGLYYGTTAFGGANNDGEVFSFNAATGTITDVGDFNNTNGKFPYSALIYYSASGLFYGTSIGGGANSQGDVFSFDTTSTNPSASISDVGDLGTSDGSGGNNGMQPFASLVYNSANGLFYGTALYGGAASGIEANGEGYGSVFSFNPAIPAANAITDVANFNGANGADSFASLVYDNGNGLLYGTARGGGVNGAGDIFSFTPAIIPTTLTVSASTASLTPAQSLTVSAYISPSAAAGSVAFTLTPTSGSAITQAVSSGSSGQFSYTFAAGSLLAGTYALSAAFTPTAPTAYSSSTASGGTVTALGLSTGALTSSAANGSIAGSSVTFTLSVASSSGTGPTPTGTATFRVDGGAGVSETLNSSGAAAYVTSALPVGPDTVTATYNGDGNYVPFSAPLSVTQAVAPPQTATTLTVSASPLAPTTAQSVTLTADIFPTSAVGTVTFSLMPPSGSPITQTVSVTGGVVTGGVATATVAAGTLSAGTYGLSAQFTPANTAAYAGSTASGGSVMVTNATMTTLASSLGANPAVFGQSITFTATVASAGGTPTGSVTFTIDGTAQAPITLVGGKATLTTSALSIGTHPITASYSGSSTFAASSTNAALTQNVNAAVIPPPPTTPTVLHTFPAGLQMISLPENYAGVSLADAWAAPAGQTLYTWNGGPDYVTGTALPAPGQGAWVILSQSVALYDTGTAASTASPFSIPLSQGWNLIGNPFTSAIAESSLEVTEGSDTLTFAQANTGAVISSTLFTYQAGDATYEVQGLSGSLLPYQGYWLYAFQLCTLLVPPPVTTSITF